RLFPAVLATLITIVAVRRRTEGTELTVAVFGLAWLVRLGVLWQVAMPLSVLGVIFWSRRAPTRKAPPLARGRIPVALTLFTALVTPGALLGWVYWMRPDLSDFTSATTDMPLAILIAGGAIFALVNATFEEWIWRGMIQSRLTTSFGLGWAIALQALSFGLAHTWGFPRGVVGVFLAGSWAVLLGILRHKAGGLLAPILAHIVADATI